MKMLRKKIVVIVEKTGTGFSAYTSLYPIASTGNNIPELHNNILEALNFYFEEQGYKVDKSNIVFQFDFRQFFRYYKVINARFLAEIIGMNPTLLSHYVQGKKKPSLKQSEKIINGIQQIGKELSELRLTNN